MCPALALCMCHRLNACAVGRYCDVSEMSGEHRGNNLQGAVIEYCVHGHFFCSDTDEKGRYGAWWVPLSRLVKQLGKDEVKEKVADLIQGRAG